MSGLAGLLAGHPGSPGPGVYRWHAAFDADELARTVAVAGWSCAHLDGIIETREQALTELGTALGFPAHYGANLDALWDCLRELPAPTVLLWDHWGVLAYADEAFFAKLLGLLHERAERPDPVDQPQLVVLLRGDGPELDIRSLD
jgi:RNAse (barnase) inhibitor barstar